jgi:hypothetical protein
MLCVACCDTREVDVRNELEARARRMRRPVHHSQDHGLQHAITRHQSNVQWGVAIVVHAMNVDVAVWFEPIISIDKTHKAKGCRRRSHLVVFRAQFLEG